MKKQKVISKLLTMIMLLSLISFNVQAIDSSNVSDWAMEEVTKADELGLIPDTLKNIDLTKPITRAEFAAISVKAYEIIEKTTLNPVTNNPFVDTNDDYVLKAFDLGITTGMSDTEFMPDTLLTREQAATMLTRVIKKTSINNWSIEKDSDFNLSYKKPQAFADDEKISDWAKDSVYFMVANGIINGMDNNLFAPKNTTAAEEETKYANATREQALLIAVRMVEKIDSINIDHLPKYTGEYIMYVSEENAPVIDGKIDDVWSTAAAFYITKSEGSLPYYETGTSYARVLWNENGYYYLGYVKDSTVNSNDRINFWVSEVATNTNLPYGPDKSLGVYAICINPEGRNILYTGLDVSQFWTAKTSKVDDGYIVEIFMPIIGDKTIGEETKLGLDISVDYYSKTSDRDYYSYLYGFGFYWKNPMWLNKIKLIK